MLGIWFIWLRRNRYAYGIFFAQYSEIPINRALDNSCVCIIRAHESVYVSLDFFKNGNVTMIFEVKIKSKKTTTKQVCARIMGVTNYPIRASQKVHELWVNTVLYMNA